MCFFFYSAVGVSLVFASLFVAARWMECAGFASFCLGRIVLFGFCVIFTLCDVACYCLLVALVIDFGVLLFLDACAVRFAFAGGFVFAVALCVLVVLVCGYSIFSLFPS